MKKLLTSLATASLLIGVSVFSPIETQAQSNSSATYTCEQSHTSLVILINGAVRYTDAMVRAYENNDQTAIGLIDFTLEYKVFPYLREMDAISRAPYYEGCSDTETEARTEAMRLYKKLTKNITFLVQRGHDSTY